MSFALFCLENGLSMSHPCTRARPIIIDGVDVGLDHGRGTFSFLGIVMVVADWQQRGHKVEVIMPPQFDPNPGSHRAVMLDLAGLELDGSQMRTWGNEARPDVWGGAAVTVFPPNFRGGR